MKKLLVLLLLIITIFVNIAVAKEIVFVSNQTEYYFPIGQDAVLPLTTQNPFEENITGTLSYTIRQATQQQGTYYTNANTQSTKFTILEDDNDIFLGLGKQQTPTELEISFKFSYIHEDKYDLTLDGLIIHFFDPEKQDEQKKQEQQEKESSPEEKQSDSKKEEMQDRQQQLQDKLQNNQQSQDSSALKKEMQQEMQEQEKQEQQMKEELEKNEEFQQMQQEMQEQGYNRTGLDVKKDENNNTQFEAKYEKGAEQIDASGEMNNNTINNLEQETSYNEEMLKETLKQDEEYNKLKDDLEKQGFKSEEMQTEQKDLNTEITQEFKKDNETVNIKANFEKEELKKVELETKKSKWPLFLVPLGLVLICLGLYLLMKKSVDEIQKNKIVKTFNYKKEAKQLLEKAKKNYGAGNKKEGYTNISQAVRMYLSYKHGLKKEITNSELLRHIKNKNKKDIRICLNSCTMVEFARTKPSDKEFNNCLDIGDKIIN